MKTLIDFRKMLDSFREQKKKLLRKNNEHCF